MKTQLFAPLWSSGTVPRSQILHQRACAASIGRGFIHIRPTQSASSSAATTIPLPVHDGSLASAGTFPDATFDVLGAPFSLLSVSLSASQNLYTRRGTLVALNGKPENVVSTLSILSPFQRGPVGVPFLYQRINSTSPITALISTNSAATSFTTVHLDGRVDWIVAQRAALLAWTGHALIVKPKINFRMSLAHWGNTRVTGRGLLGLVGKGQVHQIKLKADEEYVIHPNNVIAYSLGQYAPQPYRFKSTSLKLQIPSLSSLFPNTRFWHEMRNTAAWRFVANTLFHLRTWARRSIWGDRLFLQFKGPTTILVQSRGSRITDSMSSDDINEIADAPAGSVRDPVQLDLHEVQSPVKPLSSQQPRPSEQITTVKYATVGPNHKVVIK